MRHPQSKNAHIFLHWALLALWVQPQKHLTLMGTNYKAAYMSVLCADKLAQNNSEALQLCGMCSLTPSFGGAAL